MIPVRASTSIGLALALWTAIAAPVTTAPDGIEVRASRLRQNPLITVDSSRSLGDNVNGPSIIRVPSWVHQPLGRYYLYFAHHKGHHIRLAYADAIAGPWKVHEPGVVQVRDTAFFRPQPDPPDTRPGLLHTRRVA